MPSTGPKLAAPQPPSSVANDNNASVSDMLIYILPLEGTFDTGLTSLMDTFALADELAVGGVEPGLRLHTRVVAVRDKVHTQQGLRVPVAPIPAERPDVVVVPALGCKFPATLSEALQRPDTHDATGHLLDFKARGVTLSAACTGTYVLAHAGVLDGGRATTSWWLGPDFRQRFPEVELDDSKMVVSTATCVTAGAALAHVDLALWLIRQRSPALASTTARYLLSDTRTSQAAYAIVDQLAHADPMVERFERWARAHLADFSLSEAARQLGTTERTLQRRIKKLLGRTPIAYVQDLRVARAIHRLQTSDETVDAIAEEVGYQDATTLRTLLRKRTGRGLRELRGQ